MVDGSVDQKGEIRAYIKASSKLGCSLKQLMTEISPTQGPSFVSYDTIRCWKNKFESCVESIKMHQNQVVQNLQFVKRSFKKRKSLKEMQILQFVILHEK